MSYLEKARELQTMVAEGQMMEALNKFYKDDCVIIEMPNAEVRHGKEAQRASLEEWMKGVRETHDGGIKSLTSNEEEAITTCESWVDITTADGYRMKMEEVAVQKWDGDLIAEERFYYHMPSPVQTASDEE